MARRRRKNLEAARRRLRDLKRRLLPKDASIRIGPLCFEFLTIARMCQLKGVSTMMHEYADWALCRPRAVAVVPMELLVHPKDQNEYITNVGRACFQIQAFVDTSRDPIHFYELDDPSMLPIERRPSVMSFLPPTTSVSFNLRKLYFSLTPSLAHVLQHPRDVFPNLKLVNIKLDNAEWPNLATAIPLLQKWSFVDEVHVQLIMLQNGGGDYEFLDLSEVHVEGLSGLTLMTHWYANVCVDLGPILATLPSANFPREVGIQILVPQSTNAVQEMLNIAEEHMHPENKSTKKIETFKGRAFEDMSKSLSHVDHYMRTRFPAASAEVVNPSVARPYGSAKWSNLSVDNDTGVDELTKSMAYIRMNRQRLKQAMEMDKPKSNRSRGVDDELLHMFGRRVPSLKDVLLDLEETVRDIEKTGAMDIFSSVFDYQKERKSVLKEKRSKKKHKVLCDINYDEQKKPQGGSGTGTNEHATKTKNSKRSSKRNKSKTLHTCEQPSCKQMETMPREFKACAFCSARYCSQACAKIDWRHHKKHGCKSSQVDAKNLKSG